MDKSIIKPGVIFYSSWGYEQTNVSFYQVISTVGKCTVEIRKLSKTNCTDKLTNFYGKTMPNKNQFNGELFRKRVLNGIDDKPFIKINDFERAYLWDGEPLRYSTYA